MSYQSSKAATNERTKTLSGVEGRHARKCRICNHPDRAAIEFDYINWRHPAELVKSFELRDLSTIYRHAHATGLVARRRLNLRGLMERIAERVSEVPITAAAIIRAARAIAHINDAGEWIDPPARLIVTHEHTEAVGSFSSTSACQAGHGSVRGTAGRDASAVHTGSDKTRRHKAVRLSLATRLPTAALAKAGHSSLATVFDDAMLDEPSPDAAAAGEKPKSTDGPKEIVLALEPELQKLRIQRWEAIQADRKANEAKNAAFVEQVHKESAQRSGGFTPPASHTKKE